MEIEYERHYPLDKYSVDVRKEKCNVLSDEPVFQSGGLFYFRKTQYEYLVLSKGRYGQWVI